MLFIQPLVWWLNKLIDREREYACDDGVLEYNDNSYLYARMLIKLKNVIHPPLKSGINIAEQAIVHRIKRLTMGEKKTEKDINRRGRYIFIVMLLSIGIGSMCWSSYHLHYVSPEHENKDVHSNVNNIFTT